VKYAAVCGVIRKDWNKNEAGAKCPPHDFPHKFTARGPIKLSGKRKRMPQESEKEK
jgi:hypothetical protein